MKEFFPEIPYIKYEGPKSKNPFAFRYYDPDRVINGKKMREHLKFALSYWHTMCGDGTDMFGRGRFTRTRLTQLSNLWISFPLTISASTTVT